MHKCGSTIDQSILLGQIKRSIKQPDNIAHVKSMSGLNQIVTYLKGKYKMDPCLGILSLSQFKDLKFPLESIEISIKDISFVLPQLKLLQEYNLLGKLHRGILGNLESKCFVNIRLQIYNNKKSKKMERFRANILACDQDSVIEDL